MMSALAHPFRSIPFSTTVEVWGEMSLSLVLILALIAELCSDGWYVRRSECI